MQVTGSTTVSDGYRGAGPAWSRGPAPAYERMAAAAIARLPQPVRGQLILDLGAGTGAASRCIARAGGRPIALDIVHDMLLQARHDHRRLTDTALACVVSEGERLPFHAGCFDAVVATFSLSHMARPGLALEESRRVLRSGGHFISVGFADEDAHPAKACVDNAAISLGFHPPDWHAELKQLDAAVNTPHALKALASSVGLVAVRVKAIKIETGVTTAADLVRWRMGMAHLAPFVAGLPPTEQARLMRKARAELGPASQPWRPTVLVLSSRAPA
jgi:SAM-dependent methyltransferase